MVDIFWDVSCMTANGADHWTSRVVVFVDFEKSIELRWFRVLAFKYWCNSFWDEFRFLKVFDCMIHFFAMEIGQIDLLFFVEPSGQNDVFYTSKIRLSIRLNLVLFVRLLNGRFSRLWNTYYLRLFNSWFTPINLENTYFRRID